MHVYPLVCFILDCCIRVYMRTPCCTGALVQNRYEEALSDYSAASDIFNALRDVPRYSDARANYALTLYELGRQEEAVKAMRDVVRKNPGYADMRVALAADSWSRGDYISALKV